jgi:hypothetical protein
MELNQMLVDDLHAVSEVFNVRAVDFCVFHECVVEAGRTFWSELGILDL